MFIIALSFDLGFCIFSRGNREYGCRLPGKTRLQNNVLCLESAVKLYLLLTILKCGSKPMSCALGECSKLSQLGVWLWLPKGFLVF